MFGKPTYVISVSNLYVIMDIVSFYCVTPAHTIDDRGWRKKNDYGCRIWLQLTLLVVWYRNNTFPKVDIKFKVLLVPLLAPFEGWNLSPCRSWRSTETLYKHFKRHSSPRAREECSTNYDEKWMCDALNTYCCSGSEDLDSFGICKPPRDKRRKRRKSARPISANYMKDRPLMERFQSRGEKPLQTEYLFFKLMDLIRL